MNSRLRNSSIPSPVAHDTREHGDHALVLDPELWVGLEVDLVQDDDLRPLLQAGAVRGELGVDRAPLLVGRLGRVDHVDQRARALEMREEVVTEADTFARAFDQSRHVGDDELAAVGRLDRAEHRLKRRERIVGDFGARIRDPRDQRRLARVRQAHECGVGEQLQVQLEVPFVARHSHLGKPRHLPRRTDEARVAAPAVSAARNHDTRMRLREVGDEIAAVEHLRADGNAHVDRLAVGAVLARAAAVAAFARLDRMPPLQVREIAERWIGDEDDVTAFSTVAAVGPALGDELLAAKRQPAVATAAGLDVKLRAVGKRG